MISYPSYYCLCLPDAVGALGGKQEWFIYMSSPHPDILPAPSAEPGEAMPLEQQAAPGILRDIRAEMAFAAVEDELVQDVARLEPALSGREDPAVQDEVLAREKSFFFKVFTAALEMADRQPGPVTLLFDVDFTITHHRKAQARPALNLAVRELDDILGDRLKIGVVSSRSGRSLGEELRKPTYTDGFNCHLDGELLISSGDLYRSDPAVRELLDGNDTEAQIAAVKDVLDPEIMAQARQGRIDMRDFLLQDPKLIVLQEIITKHPDGAFVLFDDLPQAAAVRDDSPRVKGVLVKDEVLAAVWLPYAGLSHKASPEEPELLAA